MIFSETIETEAAIGWLQDLLSGRLHRPIQIELLPNEGGFAR
jgi:hypothetical protein